MDAKLLGTDIESEVWRKDGVFGDVKKSYSTPTDDDDDDDDDEDDDDADVSH